MVSMVNILVNSLCSIVMMSSTRNAGNVLATVVT